MRYMYRKIPRLDINSYWIKICTLVYIYIPIAIFVAGFVKTAVSIPTLFIIGMAVAYFCKNQYNEQKENKSPECETVKIDLITLAIVTILAALICVVIGWGGVFPQAGDWYKHNAVLNDLTRFDWPVYYSYRDECMLTYYLGQYLVPALIGKIFNSFMVSNVIMAVWGFCGLVLVYINMIRVVNASNIKKQLVAFAFLFFFGGALGLAQIALNDVFGQFMNSLGSHHWILVKNVMLQYRSNMIMLMWVFPQCIVPWLAVLLFLEKRRSPEYYVLIILPTLLYGSFSFAALFIMALSEFISISIKDKANLRRAFSISNVSLGVTLGGILFFYFLGNLQVKKPYESSFRWQLYPGKNIWIYLIFCLCMFGAYAICVYRERRKDVQWYVNTLILLFLPFCRMGLCNDVVMSASIPSLFVLMILCVQLLFTSENGAFYQGNPERIRSLTVRKTVVIVVFLIGAWYPAMELRNNAILNWPGIEISDDFFTMEWFTDRNSTEFTEDLVFNYYTYDLDDNKIFYKYLARHKIYD